MNQAVSPEAAEAFEEESALARTAGNPNTPNPARVYDALLGVYALVNYLPGIVA